MTYYILDNKIVPFEEPLSSEFYTHEPLTQSQAAFYEMYNCSVAEVLAMQLNPVYELTLEQAKVQKLAILSQEAFNIRSTSLPEYKLVNAALGIYDAQTVASIQQTVIAFRDEFYRLKTLVDEAETIGDINAISHNYYSLLLPSN